MFSAKNLITEINILNRMIQTRADFGAEPLVRFGEVHRGIAPPPDRNLCEQTKTTLVAPKWERLSLAANDAVAPDKRKRKHNIRN